MENENKSLVEVKYVDHVRRVGTGLVIRLPLSIARIGGLEDHDIVEVVLKRIGLKLPHRMSGFALKNPKKKVEGEDIEEEKE